MSGGSPERDSHPLRPTATAEEASMTVASSNPGPNPESSSQEQPSGTYAPAQQPTPIESSQPAPDPPDISTSASADPSKKQPPLMPLPSRTSSRGDKQSTLENSHETTNHNSDSSLRPRRSILNRRREKSRGSSRRSRRQHHDVPDMEGPKAATDPNMHRPPPTEKKSKRSSKLFAILTCCASSSDDTQDTVPPKKTARQTGPNTQPTPEKIDVNTGDSSTVEPREPNHVEDEKANLTVPSDQPQSSEEERNLSFPENESQVDGTASAARKSELGHGDAQKEGTGSKVLDGPQETLEVAAMPEKVDDTPHKTGHDETATAAQVTEGSADQADSIEKPSLAGDSDKGDSKGPVGKEDAMKSPTGLLPPPPMALPEKQEPIAPSERPPMLLPPAEPHLQGRKCLVLDLDETLVHSSFKVLERADFTIPVEIEGQYHNIYVIKRPGVDQFMKRVGELYEVVIFTASVAKYGDPLLDQLDIHNAVHHRLFRDSCFNHQGNYVKDLSQVGRNLRETIIIDNSPTSYIFHPQHAIPISSWFSDAHDNELLDLIPVLEDLAGVQVRDVSLVLDISC